MCWRVKNFLCCISLESFGTFYGVIVIFGSFTAIPNVCGYIKQNFNPPDSRFYYIKLIYSIYRKQVIGIFISFSSDTFALLCILVVVGFVSFAFGGKVLVEGVQEVFCVQIINQDQIS